MKYLNVFSVPIQIIELELDIDSLIEFCYEMKRKNEEGVEISNIGGWQSDNIFDETHTEFVKLKNKIEEAANVYHHKIQLKKTLHQELDNIWVNINQKGCSNEYHNHPGAILSGAFYLTKAESSIVFYHPYREISTYFWNDSIIEKYNPANSVQWKLEPEPNILLVFPSWAMHRVSVNKEDVDRITFSFNTLIPNWDVMRRWK